MSISELLNDVPHPWANLRVNDLTVDGTYNGPGGGGDSWEEFIMDVTYDGSLWDDPLNRKIRFYKSGKIVIMQMDAGKQIANGVGREITVVEKLPVRFIPYVSGGLAEDSWCSMIPGFSANGYEFAYITIPANGFLKITFRAVPAGVLTGIDNLSFTWVAAVNP